jgi:Uma2 family endonuclease
MTTATVGTRLTAEQFARLPQPEDGTLQELVRGVMETMPPPGFLHGVCCNAIGYLLQKHVREQRLGFVTNNDSGVILERDPDTVRGPDVAYWGRERLPSPPQEGYPDVAPDLVVEVLSPHDLFPRVLRKLQEYLRAGVRLVWVVVPEDRSVSVHAPGQQPVLLAETETLSGGDVLPGFQCRVAELFG